MTTDTASARPHRARRGEGERLRGELVEAAEQLLMERGSMDAVSMRAIAERTGVTPPSIYLHFDDKDELFFEVCQTRFFDFASSFVRAAEHLDDPIEQLRTMGRAYIEWGLSHPEHYSVLFGSGIGVPDSVDVMSSPGRVGLTAVQSAIERGIAGGVVEPVDPVDAAITLWSMVHGFVHLALHKSDFVPDLDLRGSRDQVIEIALRGLVRR